MNGISRYTPHDYCHLCVRETTYVYVGKFVARVKPAGEEVRKLVELAELPLSIRRVSSAAD